MVKILIVDPGRSVRNILKERLEFEGFHSETAENLTQAYELYEKTPFDIVICDGELFEQYVGSEDCHRFGDSTALIILSDSPSINAAVHAIKAGAFDFVAKPVDMNHLLSALRSVSLETDNFAVRKQQAPVLKSRKKKSPRIEDIIGNSPQINRVKNLIDRVAPSEARVLISGANGTGKELVAKWLHEKSHRSDKSFVEVNCAAIPSELIESELFGHEKGAFTSAHRQKPGKFEQANGGTLFLDEIGDMSLSAQAKVLRALQENRICRVGSDRDIEVDVRVLAATNKNLREEIAKGNFREDLYHRISVILITVPALVDRLEDIPQLVSYFVDKISAEYGICPKPVHDDAMEELKRMGWSGNIRELRNVIERLIILCESEITSEDVRQYALSVV